MQFMTFQGQVKNGLIVPDVPIQLPDGVKVEVRVLPVPESDAKVATRKGSLKEICGIIKDMPPDASQRIDEILYGIEPE
jgi:hypothetical protein